MTSVTEDRRRGTSPASIPEPTGEIHEAAAVFPMLPEDELQELAEDIKANGLLDPIVLDHDGALVDGRNRLAACRIAGVEPRYTSLNGHDPVTYILSKNVSRRNLTKGQRAMAVARIRLQNRQSVREAAELYGADRSYLGHASVVIEHAPDLADAVMAGTMPLNAAYEEARQRKAEAETREERAKRDERNLAMLRINAPDLADLVAEERMALGEAMGAYETRQREEREKRVNFTQGVADSLAGLYGMIVTHPDRVSDWWIPEANRLRDMRGLERVWTSAGLRDIANALETAAADIDRNHGGALS